MKPAGWLIVGQGLAGTCLAWHLWWRNAPFLVIDDGRGGSSRIAAGLINPVTGKNFEPSQGISSALPEALDFYRKAGGALGADFWHPMDILRLAGSGKEWEKITSKIHRPDVAPWINPLPPDLPEGWTGGVRVIGGGRLDTRGFLDASKRFFHENGCFTEASWDPSSPPGSTILCDGASGLLAGRCGTHRCAKGEILTIRCDQTIDHIRVGAGGWLVPVDNHHYKVGATYSWDALDDLPTTAGRETVTSIARRLAPDDFEIVNHQVGIRPILRRSEPLIGPLPDGPWIFNGLGSKGSLHAPSTARRLAEWLVDGITPDSSHDIRHFTANH